MTTIVPAGFLDWANLLAVLNVLIYFSIFVINFKLFKRLKIARILRIPLMVIALYWTAIYVYVVLTPAGAYDPIKFGQIFIRPGFTFTGAVILACGVYRLKSK